MFIIVNNKNIATIRVRSTTGYRTTLQLTSVFIVQIIE